MNLPLILVVALAAYRIWRFLGRDLWPPIRKLREAFTRWLSRHDGWDDGIDCPWCLGTIVVVILWIALVVYDLADVELPALHALASATVVGMLARWDDG